VPAHINVVFDQTYALLPHAAAGAINSGTATLETALFRLPQVVCYGITCSRLAMPILRRMVKIPHVSLVNIIAQKEVVKELLGHHFTAASLTTELKRLLNDTSYRNRILCDYDALAQSLGTAIASNTAAKDMLQGHKSKV
jgi:lipid-A-disaccharide synthase